jgi:hypothetical protein
VLLAGLGSDILKVLVACEESQTITKAFRAFGHEAYSCDILPCSGGFPEWHIQDDALNLLHFDWDILIAHQDHFQRFSLCSV